MPYTAETANRDVLYSTSLRPTPLQDSAFDPCKQDTNTPWTLGELTLRGQQRWPNAVALCAGSRRVTFRELHNACTAFASELSAHGVAADQRVVILCEKSIETVVAILACAQLGACFVPLDPNAPPGRRKQLLQDADARCVVASARRAGAADSFIAMDHCLRDEAQQTPHALRAASAASAVAYIMYTSGSTGHPKGVMIEHRAIEAFFVAHNQSANIGPGDRCMNTGPFHFDVCMLDVFLPLYSGASVVLTPELPLPSLLLRTLAEQRITHFYAVGSILALITGDGSQLDHYDLSALRVLQTGAEVCNPSVVNQWLRRWPELGFVNSYGPTEVTVGCSSYVKPQPGCLPDTAVPIGFLHAGCRAALLTEQGELSRSGPAEGELLLAGDQLMRGYFRRDLEERAAFLSIGAERYYRTGDIVRRDASDVFHYVGRRDLEVKISGCRVHLNEVKRSLEASELVHTAMVGSMLFDGVGRRVVTALVPRGPFGERELQQLMRRLRDELPGPFMPQAFLVLDQLPRLACGKTDGPSCLALLDRLCVQRGRLACRVDGTELGQSASGSGA